MLSDCNEILIEVEAMSLLAADEIWSKYIERFSSNAKILSDPSKILTSLFSHFHTFC